MARVVFRLYAELNDRLPPERRQRPFAIEVAPALPLGEALAALGTPAEEVDLALVNGVPAPLTHPLAEGDRVAAFPVFESFDLSALSVTREPPLRRPRFHARPPLLRLALALRALGFECTCGAAPAPDGAIVLAPEPAPAGATHWVRLAGGWREQLPVLVARLHLEGRLGSGTAASPLGRRVLAMLCRSGEKPGESPSPPR